MATRNCLRRTVINADRSVNRRKRTNGSPSITSIYMLNGKALSSSQMTRDLGVLVSNCGTL
jgi:hypothetical protein